MIFLSRSGANRFLFVAGALDDRQAGIFGERGIGLREFAQIEL